MGTPPPSSPLPPPVGSKDTPPQPGSIPAPVGNSSEGQEKRHGRSVTPQPEATPSQLQGDDSEIGPVQDGAKPPEINVQSPESEQNTAQQLSMSEAGAQVEEFVVIESNVEGTKKEGEDFGDFQGAVGEETAAVTTGAAAAMGDVSQVSPSTEVGTVDEVSQGRLPQESGPPPSLTSTDMTTNLQQPTPDTATVTGECALGASYTAVL